MKSIRFLALLNIFMLLNTWSCSAFAEQFTKSEEFEKIGKNYGNKTKNLAILDGLIKEYKDDFDKICKEKEISIAVPEFRGISSKAIKDILKKLGIDLSNRWKKISENLMNLGFYKVDFLAKEEELPKEFLEPLKKLSDDIKDAAKKLENININLELTEISDFIKEANEKTWHLMVRSTGKEDSELVANAGGNESVVNVSPDKESIIKAILDVVASYVSPKSITQRHDAGDPTIFDFPFVPVLLQRMIGETFGGVEEDKEDEIPAGCVVYTVEQSGELKTVTVMNASLGHPEGVVNSSVGLDRFYVDDDMYKIFPVIKKKPTRLVPAVLTEGEKTFGLIRLDNPTSLINAPSLDNDMIIAITKITREIQKAYGCPLDLEIVVEQKAKKIWFVQARPIQKAKEQAKPSYVSDFSSFNPDNIFTVSTVHPAYSTVLHINNASQIITGSTLEDALKTYLLQETIKSKVKAVIVAGDAELTSHAAAVFRGTGIAIIIAEDTAKIKELLDKKNISFLIDVQQEKIIDLVKEKKGFKDLTNIIQDGWITFPVPLEKTVSEKEPVFGPERQTGLATKEFKDLIYTLKKTTNSNEFIDNVDAIAYKLNDTIYKTKTNLSFVIAKIQKVYQDTTKIAQQLRERFGEKPGKEFDLERLYYIKQLEALLFQKTRMGLVDVFSHDSLQAYVTKAQEFIEKGLQPALGEEKISEKLMNDEYLFNLAMNGYDCASSDELGSKWALFINTMCNDEKTLPDFKTMTHVINDLNMLPPWINVSFAEKVKASEKKPSIIYSELYQEYSISKKDLALCKKLFQTINTFDIATFESPENFDKKLSLLIKDIFEPLKKNMFLDLVKNQNTPLVTVFAVIEVMKTAVDRFDLAIKALTGSTAYKENKEDLNQNFIKMLDQNHELFITWSAFIQNENTWKRDELNENIPNTREGYVKWLKQSFENIKSKKEDLYPSEPFNVNQSIFDSKTGFMLKPKTCEDMFTLLHQNLIRIINKLLIQHKVDVIFQPPILTKFKTEINKYMINLDNLFAGLSFSEYNFTKTYNIPLLEHSASIVLKCNKNVLWFTIKFFGQNWGNRWNRNLFFFNILSIINKTPLVESKLTNTDVILTLKITDKSDTTNLHKDINFFLGTLDYRNQVKKSDEKEIMDLGNRHLEKFNQLKTEEKNALINTLSELLKNDECTNDACSMFASLLIEKGLKVDEIFLMLSNIKNKDPNFSLAILTNKILIQRGLITTELIEAFIDKALKEIYKIRRESFYGSINDNLTNKIMEIITNQDLLNKKVVTENTVNGILLLAQKEDDLDMLRKIITSNLLMEHKIITQKIIVPILDEILNKILDEIKQSTLKPAKKNSYLEFFNDISLIEKNFITKKYINELIESITSSKTYESDKIDFLVQLFSQENIIKKQLISSQDIKNFIKLSPDSFVISKLLNQGEALIKYRLLTEEILKNILEKFKSDTSDFGVATKINTLLEKIKNKEIEIIPEETVVQKIIGMMNYWFKK